MRHSTKTSSNRASQKAGRSISSIIGACVLALSVLACGPREKSNAGDTTAASATTSATTSTTASADTTAAGTSATASTPAAAETTRQSATGEAAVATGQKHAADTTTHAADTTKHARKVAHHVTKKTDTTAMAAATTTSAAAAPAPAAQPQQDTTKRTAQGTDTTKGAAQGTDTTKAAATTASGGKDPSCFQENGAKGVQPSKPGADPLAVNQSEYDGWKMWHVYCYRCHGVDAMGSDIAPNLRHSVGPDGTVNHTCFVATVTQGRLQKGMPSWRALLSDQQIEDVWAYLQARASGRLAAGRPHVAKTTSGS
jgi:mono/diheme cytochrome c family protein